MQTSPTSLRVRLRPAADADPEGVWRTVHAELTRMLAHQGVERVSVERGEEAPQRSPGGKQRKFIPLS